MNNLQNDPTAKAYIMINGKKIARNAAEKRIKDYIKLRGSDFERLVFLYGKADKTTEIELWLVPSGAKPPAPKAAIDAASEKFEMPNEPFIFSKEYVLDLDESLDVEGYAEVLKEYPKSRGNIVILETSRKLFNRKEKEILAQLSNSGINRNRLKTFFKKVKAEEMQQGIKLWVLP